MNLFVPAFTAFAFVCSCASTWAQSGASSSSPSSSPQPAAAITAATPTPTDTGMLSGIGRWFANDWDQGWETGSSWRLAGSPGTYHYSHDAEHTTVFMLGIERQRSDGFLAGGSLFKNSFGQPSGYLYVGQRFDRLGGIEPMFAQLTGGIIYGYRAPFNHKVPLNYRGLSPGVVPSLGWQFTRVFSAQLDFLGNSAVMFQMSISFR